MTPLFGPEDIPLLHGITALLLGALVFELHTRRKDRMPRKSADFRREATKIPYDMELENGNVVVFQDPNRLITKTAFQLAKEQDPEVVLRKLLGDDFDKFWEEFGERPQDETEAVMNDVMKYYGAEPGKLGNSPS